MTRRPAGHFEETAELVSRLATLLSAGVAPGSAWRHLAKASEAAGVLTLAGQVASTTELDHDIPERMLAATSVLPDDRSAWSAVVAAWLVARDSGAPLAPSLLRLAAVLRSFAQAEREVGLALAGPVATARIIVFLPAVGVAFALLLGLRVLPVLLATPLGLGCLGVGIGLIVVGVRTNRRMIRAASVRDATVGLGTDLMVIALSGGGSSADALGLVDRSLATAGLAPAGEAIEEMLAFSATAGVPVVPLLLAAADQERRVELAASLGRATMLGTRLLLPLGLCFLPAFVVLGVLPTMIAVVSSTSLGLG